MLFQVNLELSVAARTDKGDHLSKRCWIWLPTDGLVIVCWRKLNMIVRLGRLIDCILPWSTIRRIRTSAVERQFSDRAVVAARRLGTRSHERFGPAKRKSRRDSDSPAGDKGWLGGERWHSFSIDEVKARDFKLDGFKWLKEESGNNGDELPEPAELVTDAISELEEAIAELNQITILLENGNGAGVAK